VPGFARQYDRSKAADSLNGRVHACWINPALPPAPPPAASAQSPTTTR